MLLNFLKPGNDKSVFMVTQIKTYNLLNYILIHKTYNLLNNNNLNTFVIK